MQGKILATLALSLTLLSGAPALQAGAHGGDPEVKYRQDVMAALGKHFSALAALFTGRVERPGQLQVHADALAATAKLVGTLFPEGSDGGAVLPVLWDEPERVAEAAEEAAETTAALATAAAGDDRAALAQAFKAAGDSCKACHDRYQAED